MLPSDKIILASVKLHPTAEDLARLDGLISLIKDWNSFVLSAIDRGAGPMLYRKLTLLPSAVLIPAGAVEKLKQSYYRTLSRSMIIYDAFGKVAKSLNAAGIKVVALKGIYLAEWLYVDIGLRQLSDMDLLISAADGERAVEVLQSMGYTAAGNEFSEYLLHPEDAAHYPPMVRNGVSVELHTRLHKGDAPYRIDPASFISEAVPATVYGAEVFVPEFTSQLMFLCVHADKHFTGSKIQFTCYSDIANILFDHGTLVEWSGLVAATTQSRCEEAVFRQLMLTHTFFGAPLPDTIINNYTHFLTHTDREKFLHYLQGFMSVEHHFGNFSRNVRSIEGAVNKLRFVLRNLFPPKHYMLSRYRIKNPRYYWLWYPYRHWLVLKSMLGKATGKTAWVKA